MAIGMLVSFNNRVTENLLIPPDSSEAALANALDDQELAMLMTLLPKNAIYRKIVLDQIVPALLAYPTQDKFIPLCLIWHGIREWTRDDLISSASMKWLVALSFALGRSEDELEIKITFIKKTAHLWEEKLGRHLLQEEHLSQVFFDSYVNPQNI